MAGWSVCRRRLTARSPAASGSRSTSRAQTSAASGNSPGGRLFDAAACGAAIITEEWRGIEEYFEPYVEILPASSALDVEQYLDLSDAARRTIGMRARDRVLSAHTAEHRAIELEA